MASFVSVAMVMLDPNPRQDLFDFRFIFFMGELRVFLSKNIILNGWYTASNNREHS